MSAKKLNGLSEKQEPVSTLETSHSGQAKESTVSENAFDITNPEETMRLANDLARFINENKLFHNIQGKNYVNVEGWQYAGSRLGGIL